MLHEIDILSSTLSSTARYWRGTNGRPAATQPGKPLKLYEFESCPYCRIVREALTELDLDALLYPCPKGGTRFRQTVRMAGGRMQFPYLVDDNTGIALYESADIVAYLYETYGGRPAPSRLLRPLEVATSTLSSVLRPGRGLRARASHEPARPLELFSFESSPFSRPVRELLCVLELPYLLRNTGKAMWQDLGPPGIRRTLFPDLPVQGRNRLVLLERTGQVQVPYLVDPNTGTEMFESKDICAYLVDRYAA